MNRDTGVAARLRSMGPAAIITSAFIGPGTIVTATVAGTTYGYSLLWVVLLAVVALMVLMEMAARIGIASGHNAVDAAIKTRPNSRGWAHFVRGFVIIATLAVCFAFEAGNIAGSAAGLADITGIPMGWAASITAVLVLLTIVVTSYRAISLIMQAFVALMVVVFLVTLVSVAPPAGEVAASFAPPTIPEGGVITALALVGTTLIGVNLILHSMTARERWHGSKDVTQALGQARFDIGFNVILGGIITASIIAVAAAVLHGTGAEVKSPLVFTASLEPVLGSWARGVGDLGLFAAGVSSAIAVPFTMRTIVSQTLDLKGGIGNNGIRLLAGVVVALALGFVLAGISPTSIIIFAQATSGLILPFIALLLLIAANNRALLGERINGTVQNVIGGAAVLMAFVLGAWGLYNVVGKLIGG